MSRPAKLYESGKPIFIIGTPNMKTVFNRPDAILSNNCYIIFSNITFTRRGKTGVKFEQNARAIVFDRCTFSSNSNHGLKKKVFLSAIDSGKSE